MPREPFTSAGSPKKGRKWTPQLHKAFLEAADAMGPAAVPAAILEHMGPAAAGLTRDAVAAHLQKHRSGVVRSGSRKSLDGGGVGCGSSGDGRKGLASLRTRSTPNFVSPRPCRRSPRTPRRGAALPPGLREDLRRRSETFGGTEDATSGSKVINASGDGGDHGDGNSGGGGGGGGCGLDPAWRLPPAQPPAHWCFGGNAGMVTGAGLVTGDGMSSATVFPAPLPSWGLTPVAPAGCGIAGLVGQQQVPPPLQQQHAALQRTLQQAGGCTTVTTGAAGLTLQGASAAQQLGLPGLAAIAVGRNGGGSRSSSPCTGSGGSTALAAGLPPTPPSAPSFPQPQQPQQHEPMLQGCGDTRAVPQQPQQQQQQQQQQYYQLQQQQQPQQHLTQQAPGSPDGTGAAAGDFGAAFDAAADTSFDLATGLSSDDSDGELWSMAELTAAALAIPPEVLAEADLQPFMSEASAGTGMFASAAAAATVAAANSAANSAASSPSAAAGIAAAGNAASTWGCAATAAQPQAPQMMVQALLQPTAAAGAATAASPNAYAPYGLLPPLPFRMSSGSFGGAGAFTACLPPPPYVTSGGCGNGSGSMAAMSGCGAQQQVSSPVAAALQGGPPRFTCISAPAICMGTKMAIADAVQYQAQHALMLEDLRGRPKEPPIGLKLDKQSVLEELHAAA